MYVVDRGKVRRARAIRLLRERKREKLGKMATELGYSYHYFKYSILPELLTVDCIDYDRDSNELVWVCDDESEARELLERMEQARPVQG